MDALIASLSSDPLFYADPVDFLTAEMYIPETQAPIELYEEQPDVIRAMFARGADDKFNYSTMVYSSIKKSAKTTIGGGLALWQGWRVPDGEIYIVGNDLKQADSRMMKAIRYCVENNPRMKERARIIRNNVFLDNGTKIEAVAVDAAGEAGSNPTGIFWTEAWGAKQRRHEEMWSEMALSPTRQGESFKFVESYAGHQGESLILERLYNAGVVEGQLLDAAISPELYVNGRTIVYWNTRRYLPWQRDNQDYYIQEEREKTASEFRRQHKNEWVTSEDVFVFPEWWDACRIDAFPDFGRRPLIVAMDAGVSDDCFAIVCGHLIDDVLYPRITRIWTPPADGKILYSNALDPDDETTPEGFLRRLKRDYQFIYATYDAYQLHDFATRMEATLDVAFVAFSQGTDRTIADKQLYDNIRDGRIAHDGDAGLTEHVKNANRKAADENRLRIVKRAQSMKIDACVCLSMLNYACREHLLL